jgi:hypothetical protein
VNLATMTDKQKSTWGKWEMRTRRRYLKDLLIDASRDAVGEARKRAMAIGASLAEANRLVGDADRARRANRWPVKALNRILDSLDMRRTF